MEEAGGGFDADDYLNFQDDEEDEENSDGGAENGYSVNFDEGEDEEY